MRTSEAVTGGEGIPVGYATLVVVYAALAVAVVVGAAPPRAARRSSRSSPPRVPVLAPAGFTERPADDA